MEEIERLLWRRGARYVLVVAGPSGVGKTRLAEQIAGAAAAKGHKTWVMRPYTPVTSIEELLGFIRREALLSANRALRAILAAAVRDVASLAASRIGPRTAEAVEEALEGLTGKTPLNVLEALHMLLWETAGRVTRSDRLLVVIDEAQNLIPRGSPRHAWSLVKILSSVQEHHPDARFLLVTSDHVFTETLLSEAPSPEYVEMYYLGPLVPGEAEALAEELAMLLGLGGNERDASIRKALSLVGGHPAQLRLVLPEPEEAFNRLVKRYLSSTRLRLRRVRGGGDRDAATKLLRQLASAPLDLDQAEPYTGIVAELVKANVLQYGCHGHLGVYSDDGGGAPCGAPDVVAPANRAARKALERL